MPKVLIVDDASDFGRFLRSALNTLDPSISVQVLPSAEEALLVFPRMKPDLLIVDYRLPGMSGVEMIRKVRVRYPETAVIVVTGLASEEIAAQAEGLQVNAFFRKPMPIDDFMSAVRSCLYGDVQPLPSIIEEPGRDGVVPFVQTAASEAVTSPRLPDVLTGLRQKLDAQAVLFVDDLGHIIAQAGNCVDINFEADWIPPLMMALTANRRMALALGGNNPEDLHTLRGQVYDLLYSSFSSYALLLILPAGRPMADLSVALQELVNARAPLSACLDGMGVALKLPVGSIVSPDFAAVMPPDLDELLRDFENNEPQMADFEALFKGNAPGAELKEADSFWEETLANSQSVEQSNPDVLSYDQARKLGLAPGEEEDNDLPAG